MICIFRVQTQVLENKIKCTLKRSMQSKCEVLVFGVKKPLNINDKKDSITAFEFTRLYNI